MDLKAVIFDLDGVITDTAEYHYLAWQRLADEEGYTFDRAANDQLRGVSRRASLEVILRMSRATPSEEAIQQQMERKNRYYVEMLGDITPGDLLPGALDLIQELRAAGVKVAIGSASKNTPTVLHRLGISELMDAVADGSSVERTKPAPDVFLKAAEMLDVPPAACVVIEDAESGIDAALAAGMWAIGLGPQERIGHAHARFDSLEGVSLERLVDVLQGAAWTISENRFSPEKQRHMETVFTIGNGHMCLRGALEEGHPGDMPACFMHELWDDIPIAMTELCNVPEWWSVDVRVDGVQFRLDRGVVLGYRRWLDLRTGVLSRVVGWQPSLDGPVLNLHFERFTSLADPHKAALRFTIEVVNGDAEVRVATGLKAHVENTGLIHWNLVSQELDASGASLRVRTRGTGLDLAVAMAVSLEIEGGAGLSGDSARPIECDVEGQPQLEWRLRLAECDRITLTKYVALVPGSASPDAVATAREKAASGVAEGYAAWRAASDAEWAEYWRASDVVVEGDNEAQVTLRFNIFHLLIAAPRYTEHASIGAKTLSGFGYRHHVFWDTEIFMLPLFTYTQPKLAQNMLIFRYHGLAGARRKARENGYEGAQFPWEAGGDGSEVTPTWVPHFADPKTLVRIWTGDIEIHITADVAYGVMQYWRVTGDDAWMRDYGAELILDGAKFWASAAQAEGGKYHYRNVIGPDEYHDRIDDNAYTNYMARWHLRTARGVLGWLERSFPEKAGELTAALDLTPQRLTHWDEVSRNVFLPAETEAGVIEQFTGYFGLEDADQAVLRDPERMESMQALLGIEGCAQTQNLKQPDVLMLQYLLPDLFGHDQVRANWEYYDPRTDHEHGSSLGPAISAIMACRLAQCEYGYEHFLRAARADLLDLRRNAGDGIHGASAGGLWQAAVFGFAGLKVTDDGWTTAPSLPATWTRLAFNFWHRGVLESVDLRR